VLIRSGSESAIYLGDLAIFADSILHLEWGPDWAWSREVDIASRKRIVQFAVENKSTLILGHDTKRTFVKVEATGGQYRVSVMDS
jgi:hypothetical protein